MARALTSIKPGGIAIAIAFVRQIYLSQLKAASLNSSHARADEFGILGKHAHGYLGLLGRRDGGSREAR